MPQGSIDGILREIESLRGVIRKADLTPDREFRRTRALGVLDGIEKVLTSCCVGQGGSYEEFLFSHTDSSV